MFPIYVGEEVFLVEDSSGGKTLGPATFFCGQADPYHTIHCLMYCLSTCPFAHVYEYF